MSFRSGGGRLHSEPYPFESIHTLAVLPFSLVVACAGVRILGVSNEDATLKIKRTRLIGVIAGFAEMLQARCGGNLDCRWQGSQPDLGDCSPQARRSTALVSCQTPPRFRLSARRLVRESPASLRDIASGRACPPSLISRCLGGACRMLRLWPRPPHPCNPRTRLWAWGNCPPRSADISLRRS